MKGASWKKKVILGGGKPEDLIVNLELTEDWDGRNRNRVLSSEHHWKRFRFIGAELLDAVTLDSDIQR